MATVAVLIKQEILLLFIGGVFVLEALSVILQVGSYKLRGGKRIFKMAPLHHHFEALGWQESKIIVRFWIAGLVMALFALTHAEAEVSALDFEGAKSRWSGMAQVGAGRRGASAGPRARTVRACDSQAARPD